MAQRLLQILRTLLKIGLLLGLTGALCLGGANAWVFYQSSDHRFDTREALPSRTVAIVLGAAVYPNGRPSPALRDRLQMALELYRQGKVRKVLVSGDHGKRWYDEVNTMSRWLIERGIPDEDVFEDHAGFRTFDTMVRARKVFQVEDAIVCTQAFHQPRAVFLARTAGIDAVGAPADRRLYADRYFAQAREALARALSVLDVYVLPTEPRFLGEPIPITGDPRPSRG